MAKDKNFDFIGWATKYNIKCADGRTIMNDAFANMDGKQVPVVWNHQHNSTGAILGHALLKCFPQGVKAYGSFNNTPAGKDARLILDHNDIDSLSILAFPIQETSQKHVMHGDIKEVSLVLSGANPGATIIDGMAHSDDGEDSEYAVIYSGEPLEILAHSDDIDLDDENITGGKEMAQNTKGIKHSSNDDVTIGDILDTMTDEQREAAEAYAEAAYNAGLNAQDDNDDDDDDDDDYEDYDGDGGEEMTHGLFMGNADPMANQPVITDQQFSVIMQDAIRHNSKLSEAFMAHSAEYGIDNIEYLFPEVTNLDKEPQFIMRNQEWVEKVIDGVHRTPFSRIRSTFADITPDEARAKGYTKGNRKIEEVFGLLKRETTPTTVYKKQKLDKDDISDVTTMDVVAWLRKEMRVMLNEELARAFLIGDGRTIVDPDKIKEDNIRPIWTDDDFFTVKKKLPNNATTEEKMETIIRARKDYKGSGNPILFTTEDFLIDMQLVKDTTGRTIYDTNEKLKAYLRVSDIITVPVFESATRTIGEGQSAKTYKLEDILVNLNDYNVGTDKGGAIGWHDDFDIDFNQYKYLIETRLSGALTRFHSAIAIEIEQPAG